MLHLPTYFLWPVAITPDTITRALRVPASTGLPIAGPLDRSWVPPPPLIAQALMEQANLEQEAQPREILDDERDAEIRQLREQVDEAESRADGWLRSFGRVIGERNDLQSTVDELREALSERDETITEVSNRLQTLEVNDVLGTVIVSTVEVTIHQRPPGSVRVGSTVEISATYPPDRAYASSFVRDLNWTLEGCGANRLSASSGPFVRFIPTRAGLCRVFLRGRADLPIRGRVPPPEPQDLADYGVVVVRSPESQPE